MLFLLFKVFLRSNLYQCPFPLSSIYFILQWTKILKKGQVFNSSVASNLVLPAQGLTFLLILKQIYVFFI